MTQRHTLLKLLKAYSLITFGALIYALSFNWFFQPTISPSAGSPVSPRSSTASGPFCRWA